ncbi:hypothetical protein [Stenotrophomonas sp. NPDC077659]|uniref:hypothetical protein n=1 Tax=Stenotrophomonas sp. NPDC077659 TaxID=3390694 RepID=UPI003CFFFBBC
MKQKGRTLAPWLATLLMACSQGVAAQDAAQGPPVGDADPSCPSRDFARFLRYFTDLADDRVRVRYTSDPLEYEAPAYGASGEGEAVTELNREAGPRRFRRLRATTLRATPAITPLADGGQQVRLGDDAQAEQYTFAHRYGCWMLTRVSRSW